MRRRTEGEVRRDSCDSVSFKTVRRVVQTSSQVVCDSCRRAVSAVQGCLFSDAGQSHFKRDQFIRAGCWMMAGIERWEYEDEDDVFEFGREVTADVQRRETHNCIGGASRSACRFGRLSELTTRSTTPPLSAVTGSSIEQRGCKKVHWKERRLNTLAESCRLVPVMRVSSLEQKGISVGFTCSDEYSASLQPKPLLQYPVVSLLTDQTRSGTCWGQADWRVTGQDKSSVNKLAEVCPSPITTIQEGGATSSTDVTEPVADSTEVNKTLKESDPAEEGQLLRAAEHDQGVLKVKTQRQGDTVEFTRPLLGECGEAADDPHRRH